MAAPRIAIAGALGRMGRAVAAASTDGEVIARFDRPGLQTDGLTDSRTALDLADVVIDFTTASAASALALAAAERGRPAFVIGATGFTEAEDEAVREAAKRLPIVRSGNFSLGVNILTGLVRQTAARLSALDYDIEVFEAHHRRKVDAPSGTALMLGEAAAAGRGVDLGAVRAGGRDGVTGPRPVGEIGFSVMRGGGVIGEHSVIFAAEDEVITLSHSARDRALFARGAVAAARWVVGRPAGLYSMQDVLGFTAPPLAKA
jgi:4-hydroxy-tetrahydrodipicolinate reductase